MEVEVEALELQVSDLVRGDDLQPREVLTLGVPQVNGGREEDALAVRGGKLDGDPADVAVGDLVRFLEFDLSAREGVGVHAQESVHLLQFDAGRELIEQCLGASGLEAEVGDASVRVVTQEFEAPAEPGVQLRGADAVQDAGRGAEEGADRFCRGVGEVFRTFQHHRLQLLRQLAERLRALHHERGDVAEPLPGEPLAESEVARAETAVDAVADAGRGLERAAHLAPARLGEHLGE